jgi:hypothetical protein
MPDTKDVRIFSVRNLYNAIRDTELLFSAHYDDLGILETVLKDLKLMSPADISLEHCLEHYTESMGIPPMIKHNTTIYGPDEEEIIATNTLFNNNRAADKDLAKMIDDYLGKPEDEYKPPYTIITTPGRLVVVMRTLSRYPSFSAHIVQANEKILKPEPI